MDAGFSIIILHIKTFSGNFLYENYMNISAKQNKLAVNFQVRVLKCSVLQIAKILKN